jgi:CDP-diacylglycerol--glycerol-3-phosphate 3-phosphatidyltransferase
MIRRLTLANQVTLLRILLIAPFVICMLKINERGLEYGLVMRYIALGIFLVMAGSDYLDGWLARKRNMATRLGSFLDPTADKLLITCACLLFASERASVSGFRLPVGVVVLIIGKDLFLLIGFLICYFMTYQVKIFPAKIGKWATVFQSSMVVGILIAPEVSSFASWWIYFLRILWWSAAGTAIIATFIYINNGLRYIEEYEQENENKGKL